MEAVYTINTVKCAARTFNVKRILLLAIFLIAIGFVFSFISGKTSGNLVLDTYPINDLLPHAHNQQDSASDPGHHVQRVSPIFTAPRDMYISEFYFDIINAPDVVVHHAVLFDLDHQNDTCAFLPMRELFLTGQDLMHNKTIALPQGYALKIKKGTRLQLFLAVHNPGPPVGPGGEYRNVYGHLILKESSLPSNKLSLVQFRFLHLDEIPCGFTQPDLSDIHTFLIPPHVTNFYFSRSRNDISSSFVFPASSSVVYMGGHLHGWQGGKEVSVEKNGVPFHHFFTHPSPNVPYRFDTIHFATSTHFDAGDRISISAYYSNPHEEKSSGAMGMLGFYYAAEQ